MYRFHSHTSFVLVDWPVVFCYGLQKVFASDGKRAGRVIGSRLFEIIDKLKTPCSSEIQVESKSFYIHFLSKKLTSYQTLNN
jgi:hypothetical protein